MARLEITKERVQSALKDAEAEIEQLRTSLSECVAVMEKNIYPKPDVGPEHPYSVLCRARDLTSQESGT